MAAFSYQQPFLLDSIFPQQNMTTTITTTTTTPFASSPANYLQNISSPAGLFMDEPGSSAAANFPQFYPPELFLLHSSQSSSGFDPANDSLPLQQQNNYYAFTSNNGYNGDNIDDYHTAGDCEIGGVNENEEEASGVTRKQSTDGHSSTTESGEQVTQSKKRKKLGSCNNLSKGTSHVTSIHSMTKEAREAGKSSKKAKKSSDVEVDEGTKKQQQQGESKKEQHQQRKKGADNEQPPTGYIHVRARRGQATDSHSLAERARREKISERMNMLQHLVPGCDKVTGKALMLDEIINYIQSLQNQVEFLSMKLATVNPLFYDFGLDLDGLMVRPERLSSNVVVSAPLRSGQQCNPTTAVQQQPHTANNFSAEADTTIAVATVTVSSAAAASNSCYPLTEPTCASAIFPGQRPGAFSQSQDNGGKLLWDMEEEGSQRRGFGIGSTTTINSSNNNKFCSFH